MKASLNWIKEFVDLDVPPQEVADRLSMAGLEIESVETVGDDWEGVVTAFLVKVEKHPHADRLTLCEVRTGSETVAVVCGAKNHKAGDKVALARPGTKLPNGMEIKVSEIRKVASHGMLCSEKELGLAEGGEGILILPPETPEGRPLREVLPPKDTLFEVNITPNRGDCLSMRGLAREVAAIYRLPLEAASPAIAAKNGASVPAVEVRLEAAELGPRYACRVLKGVKVGPSPLAVQRRLSALGLRPINNVVDATNYVMLETGQPLHAFDFKQIRGGQVRIRAAEGGEAFRTLDGQERRLQAGDLVIADAERVLALAGIMGGEDSGVSDTTVDLLLESAHFDPVNIRKTAKRLGMQTDSSYRFERNVDPGGCVAALHRLTQLILEWAGAEAVGEIQDAYPKPRNPEVVTLRTARIQRVLGMDLPASSAYDALHSLGLKVANREKEEWKVEVPTFRTDLKREIDLIEEVARIYGYNQIPFSYPRLTVDQMPLKTEPRTAAADEVRRRLAGWGFSEALHYSFTAPALLDSFAMPYAKAQVLANPISEDLAVLRPSLVPQMVQSIQKNIHRGNPNAKLFEIRPVYRYQENGAPPFQEEWRLSLGMSGERRPVHFQEKTQAVDLLDVKGVLEGFAEGKGSWDYETPKTLRPFLHPKRQADLYWRPREEASAAAPRRFAGFTGELHPRLMAEWDISAPVAVAEIIFDFFLTEVKNSIQFKKISPYPGIGRDLNLIVDAALPQGEVYRIIREHGGPWVRNIEFFDLYRQAPVPEGKKALTYRIEYGAEERTLTDEEVNAAREELLKVLKQQVGAYLR